MGSVISIVNQKGGVGKTTTAQALAREFAKTNKVLLIDFDGQATLTELMDLNNHFDNEFIKEYMSTESIVKIFERASIEPLDITGILKDENGKSIVAVNELHFIPSPGNSIVAAAESVSGGKDMLLNKYLQKVKDDYDYVIIDALPSVSTLFRNVLLASDALIVAIQTKTNAIAGANGFLQVLNDVLEDYDKTYNHLFILPTMYNKQRRDDKETLAEIMGSYMTSLKTYSSIGKIPTTLLEEIPDRTVFSNAQAVRYFLQDYIEGFDTGKRDILLLLENIAKVITNKLEVGGK
ncbi:ParA family protein [Sulfuricurvum sp.]|jgi:chromosome partitioning protein|uniref:ParA family protein n=1 Tax=Sulfuricurvum sp. TaxID=2025608 RepID=UPI002619E1A3|nr:ParA family protein [Sulfuricurvum sp.]MDD3595598.1 ParA family protein [Sulfuricurvum sp.]